MVLSVYMWYCNGNFKYPSDSVTGTSVSTKLSQRFCFGSSYWKNEETFRKADTKDRLEQCSREWEAEDGRNELQIGSKKAIWEAPHNKRECYDSDIRGKTKVSRNERSYALASRIVCFLCSSCLLFPLIRMSC
jgi:hypothetical protein